MPVLERWREFRRAQREALRASNHPHASTVDSVREELADLLPGRRPEAAKTQGGPAAEAQPTPPPRRDEPAGGAPWSTAVATEGATDAAAGAATGAATEGGTDAATDAVRQATSDLPFGRAGRPLNRQSPFYLGFVGAIGVLTAILLWQILGRLTTTLTLVVVAFFLTLGLNPLVETLTRTRLKRPVAVLIVFAGLVGVFALLGVVVVPPVITQGTELVKAAPDWLDQVLRSRWVQDLDRHYDVVDKIQAEANKRLTDSAFLGQVFGGVLGVGAAVATGIFESFTVLVLTLFLLASLPRVKQAAYAVVPASRRPRVISLSEEIMRRTGSYAISQVAVATINAVCSWLMMIIVGIPYAAVLAVAVGLLGLVPMVGATLGASLVCIVALFDEPKKALVAIVYYVVYQQVENYVIAPRIMQRTVSVPGAVTVVAALAGGTLLGVLGALLAIPVAAGLLLLYEEVLLPRQQRH